MLTGLVGIGVRFRVLQSVFNCVVCIHCAMHQKIDIHTVPSKPFMRHHTSVFQPLEHLDCSRNPRQWHRGL